MNGNNCKILQKSIDEQLPKLKYHYRLDATVYFVALLYLLHSSCSEEHAVLYSLVEECAILIHQVL